MLKLLVFENRLSVAKNLFVLIFDYHYSSMSKADNKTVCRERMVGRPLETMTLDRQHYGAVLPPTMIG